MPRPCSEASSSVQHSILSFVLIFINSYRSVGSLYYRTVGDVKKKKAAKLTLSLFAQSIYDAYQNELRAACNKNSFYPNGVGQGAKEQNGDRHSACHRNLYYRKHPPQRFRQRCFLDKNGLGRRKNRPKKPAALENTRKEAKFHEEPSNPNARPNPATQIAIVLGLSRNLPFIETNNPPAIIEADHISI